ncbi:DUF262 domain-containing protein [Chryseobacterium sp. L7]|uniref:DUF262 domain-containing protein n=1 Tax=Chryseobacterium endalhagicum TaxID=2797638 RepID=A0ABS1QKY2_9FLAO|nr:DUF262 domain-containing protein [Chryseobacterium endalhagicum]MBL1223283.1 DUF262 domain-containing protein [Chryseobacterium endalhagicum]
MTTQNNIISFIDLLNNETKIEIPIIQRDYAQGRVDKKDLRQNFLNAIYDSLVSSKPIQLDFIYGSKVDDNFQPLDGQQRLTTLYLLHWYGANRNTNSDELKKELLKFTYETRISSREFCEALIKNDIAIVEGEKISDRIRDSKWYFLSWDNDPTINSMLRTLDDIHDIFFPVEDLLNKLIEEKLLSFYYVLLEDIGLTDDLYIKMNARGKLLSSYENFKASFEKYIEDNNWEEGIEKSKTFAFQIDTNWTDFFWKNFKKNNSIDVPLMKFISTLLMIRISLERNTNRVTLISQIQDNFNNIKANLISKDTFEYIYKSFEIYSNLENFDCLKLNFPFWRHTPTIDFLNEVVATDRNASYTQKVLFFAQTEYLLRNPVFDKTKFEDWLRVVRNIIARGSVEKGGSRPDIIRSPETFDGIINLVNELSAGCADIYKHLSEVEKINSSFARYQSDEEIKKAKLILESDSYKDLINRMEDQSFFKGRIEFAFDCIDYDGNIENFEQSNFEKVLNIINEHFNSAESDKISNDIRRALLTIEINNEYLFYDYWSSYWYVGDANKRCLLENFRELEYYVYYTDHDVYLKKLIQHLFNNTVEEIIDNFTPPSGMPNWKIRLIKEKELLDKESKSNYIAISIDNSFCYLLKSKRPRDIAGCYKVE